METESLLTIVFIIILLEYIFRLKNETNKRAEEKFEKWKAEYLAKHGNNTSFEVVEQTTEPVAKVSVQPEDQ